MNRKVGTLYHTNEVADSFFMLSAIWVATRSPFVPYVNMGRKDFLFVSLTYRLQDKGLQ